MARKADWTVLRGTLAGFVLCVVAAAGMFAASVWFKQGMQREYQANHNRFRAASQQYLAVDEEERMIDEFYPEFVRLYRGGLIGRERRLTWLETLRGAGSAIGIPEVNYKVEAQRASDAGFGLELGRYDVYASSMQLSLGLLHEGDLLQLFHALDRDALGQYTVRSCEFRRIEPHFEIDPGRANIRAECALDWLTIDLSGDQELVL